MFFKRKSNVLKNEIPPEQLPGVRKKSFSMPFGGGEIWFEHLDGMYQYEKIVLEKLENDSEIFLKPSMPSLLAVNLDETVVTNDIIQKLMEYIFEHKKRFTKIVFVGLDRMGKTRIESEIIRREFDFAYAFINDFEKAKIWLVNEH